MVGDVLKCDSMLISSHLFDFFGFLFFIIHKLFKLFLGKELINICDGAIFWKKVVFFGEMRFFVVNFCNKSKLRHSKVVVVVH